MKTARLFDLAGPDLFVILLIVLLLFGARKLPELFRHMAEAIRGFSKAKEEFLEAMSERGKRNVAPGTVFGIVMVIVAVGVFLSIIVNRLGGR